MFVLFDLWFEKYSISANDFILHQIWTVINVCLFVFLPHWLSDLPFLCYIKSAKVIMHFQIIFFKSASKAHIQIEKFWLKGNLFGPFFAGLFLYWKIITLNCTLESQKKVNWPLFSQNVQKVTRKCLLSLQTFKFCYNRAIHPLLFLQHAQKNISIDFIYFK